MSTLSPETNTVSAYQAATAARGAMAGSVFSTLSRWLRGKR